MRHPYLSALCLSVITACSTLHAAEVRASLVNTERGKGHMAPAVIWLKPLGGNAVFPSSNNYELLQKNKMFHPHLLVVPVGSSVSFPNADPFFHNVFSLFDGRRFDLGLYEAGSTRSVTFSREGVSYIFCNIHPDMSAVVLSLVTPYYAIADTNNTFRIASVPDGDYELHMWVEGRREEPLNQQTRQVHIAQGNVDLGEISTGRRDEPPTHLNKFGKPYDSDHPTY